MTIPAGVGETTPGFRSGFVAVLGRPNVGKSTLVNQISRSKVSITSDRPQTTRSNIRSVVTDERAQVVFVDTPGIHKPRHALGEALNAAARSTVSDVDCVLFLVDTSTGVGTGDARIAAELNAGSATVFGVLNKIDACADLERQRKAFAALEVADTVFEVSARTGAGVAVLHAALVEALPPGPLWYPADAATDQPEALQIAELVREKLLRRTRDELPHSIAVVCEELRRRDDGVLIVDVVIFVERSSQKGMVIGKGGSILKAVGAEARPEIETLLGEHIFLEMRVKIRGDWQRSDDLVERFGYGL